jgi:hypothetical protein
MSALASAPRTAPQRLRRALELVYGVEGVVSARIWRWPGGIAVGVRGGSTTSPTDLIRRVELATAGLRDADESWDFGILEDLMTPPPSPAEPSDPDEGISSQRRSLRSPS